jgi:hypothetical protein
MEKWLYSALKTPKYSRKTTMLDEKKISTKHQTETPPVGLGLILLGVLCLLIGIGTGVLISIR